MLHHHPHPKEIQNYRNKLLQACGSNICGHEVIWKTGEDNTFHSGEEAGVLSGICTSCHAGDYVPLQ